MNPEIPYDPDRPGMGAAQPDRQPHSDPSSHSEASTHTVPSTGPGPAPTLGETLRIGGLSFVITGFVGRMPVATLQLVMLLAGTSALGSFAAGGLLVAAMGIGGAVGGISIGWLSDRFGQRSTGLIGTAVQVASLAALARWGLVPGAPLTLSMLLAVLVGAANPQVGAMARSRWNALARKHRNPRGLLGAAMGYEGAVDEASFVLGPILASLLVGMLPVPTVMVIMIAWLLLAQVTFLLQPGSLKPLAGKDSSVGASGLPVSKVVPLVIVVACVGLVFGSTQTGVAALLESTGRTTLTGLVYGCLGVGSGLASLATTRLPGRRLTLRIVGAGVLLAVLGIGLVVASQPVLLAVACFAVGVCVAPVLIGGYSLMGSLAPSRLVTTAMTLLAVATTVGVSLGAAMGGALVDAGGPSWALAVPSLAGVVILLAALIAARQHGELSRG